MSDNKHRWSDDPSCHYMGCSCSILYDQHWQTSEDFDSFRSAEELAVSTFRPAGEVDVDFRANSQARGSEPNIANNNMCGVEIKAPKAPKNHKDLIRSIANRKQECQKTNNKFTTESRFREPSSLSSGCEWEFERESRALEVRELCRNERMLLKNKQPYRDETNKNVLTNFEIRRFAGVYGITDFRLVLACGDSVFWLEDHNGVVYFWSRIDDSMIRGGDNLKEALTNYLFCQEKLYYVDEITRELVPINAYDKEAEKWAKSPEAYVYIDATKVSPKHESKMKEPEKLGDELVEEPYKLVSDSLVELASDSLDTLCWSKLDL
ncbi:hypothetical protein C1645_832893 [Glomus cerebriforme]|uniref:Uncharacterized protein n=1 Tax=Glomus cerebriforme TaxID=658196 RepID=A0A397SDD7_9GLOM|nr:hypothetical protein C1645_832893 [Glomus cerebriforme]